MSEALAHNLVAFGRMLRRSGIPVIPDQTRQFAAILERLGLGSRPDVKAAGRVIYVRRREEIGIYDAAFDLFWRRTTASDGAVDSLPRLTASRATRSRESAASGATTGDLGGSAQGASRIAPGTVERIRRIDFAELTPDEARDAERMVEALNPGLPRRPSRRHRLARRGRRPAMRAMLRHSLGTGGETVTWRWHRRDTLPRPIILICDISGSMERYSRYLLRFGHALGRSGAPVEVFVFGTRLTRITRELRQRNVDHAIRRVTDKVVDWSGGTRIGASLQQLNKQWVRRVMRSGAVVLLVSDGWERDDPERLGREVATLARSCHRLIWLDPLAGHPGFTPATRGLLAALPHVDAFLPCGNVESLEQLADQLLTIDN
jgi:uncharacterized protein with von Willebrand factor type A (vWA) domain